MNHTSQGQREDSYDNVNFWYDPIPSEGWSCTVYHNWMLKASTLLLL